MEVMYRIKPYELTPDFFDALKATFQGKEIQMSIKTIQDETEYLLRSEENRRRLFKSLENIKHKRYVHAMTIEELEAMIP